MRRCSSFWYVGTPEHVGDGIDDDEPQWTAQGSRQELLLCALQQTQQLLTRGDPFLNVHMISWVAVTDPKHCPV